MLVCQANWFLAKSACQEPTDRTHEHNLQAVLFIITSTIWRLGSTKLQQFAAMFALVDSLRPHEHTSLRGGYLGLSVIWGCQIALATHASGKHGNRATAGAGLVKLALMLGLWCSVKR